MRNFRSFSFLFFEMLKLKTAQHSKLLVRSLLRPRLSQHTPFRNVTRNLVTATACVSLQQQRTRYFSTFWKTTALVSAATLGYGLTSSNVFALETENSKLY